MVEHDDMILISKLFFGQNKLFIYLIVFILEKYLMVIKIPSGRKIIHLYSYK